MITRPTRQADLRAPRHATLLGHEHAALAVRLTGRDRWILAMLHEHRVLTTGQLAALAFPTPGLARRRLALLYRYGVVDRFRPLRVCGTAPAHWVLAPAGAAVLAAEIGVEVRALGYRYERALAIAHSLQLAHTVGINEWFTALTTAPGKGGAVAAWWSQTRCRHLWGDLVRPDAYGRYLRAGRTLDFFLEYDLATITLSTVAAKLLGYADLARSTSLVTPVLLWVPTAARESNLRAVLRETWTGLPDPATVPVATAAADLLDPAAAHPSPAHRIWLPLDDTATGRIELHELAAVWPRVTAPPATTDSPLADGDYLDRRAVLAPPPPIPPGAGER